MHPKVVWALVVLIISAVAAGACEMVSGLDDVTMGMSSGGGGAVDAGAGDAATDVDGGH